MTQEEKYNGEIFPKSKVMGRNKHYGLVNKNDGPRLYDHSHPDYPCLDKIGPFKRFLSLEE